MKYKSMNNCYQNSKIKAYKSNPQSKTKLHTLSTKNTVNMIICSSKDFIPGRASDWHSLGHRAARREIEAYGHRPPGCWRRTHAAAYCRTHCGRPCPHRRTTSAPGAARVRAGRPAQHAHCVSDCVVRVFGVVCVRVRLYVCKERGVRMHTYAMKCVCRYEGRLIHKTIRRKLEKRNRDNQTIASSIQRTSCPEYIRLSVVRCLC